MSVQSPATFASARLHRLTRIAARFLTFSRRVTSRRRLSRLDDHLLRDIGLTRSEAETEARRPFWDPPLHWKG
jgi:uncharacterized protein YjiS (DUF1127 family)